MYMIGDDLNNDVLAAQVVGMTGVLVRTGMGKRDECEPQPGTIPDAVVDNLMDAAAWILEQP